VGDLSPAFFPLVSVVAFKYVQDHPVTSRVTPIESASCPGPEWLPYNGSGSSDWQILIVVIGWKRLRFQPVARGKFGSGLSAG